MVESFHKSPGHRHTARCSLHCCCESELHRRTPTRAGTHSYRTAKAHQPLDQVQALDSRSSSLLSGIPASSRHKLALSSADLSETADVAQRASTLGACIFSQLPARMPAQPGDAVLCPLSAVDGTRISGAKSR